MIADFRIEHINTVPVLRFIAAAGHDWLNMGIILNNDMVREPAAVTAVTGAANLIYLNQIHSNHIIQFTDTSLPLNEYTGDGVILDKPGAAAVVKTADCFPVFAVSRQHHRAAVLHCGRAGIFSGIIFECITALGNGTSGAAAPPVWYIGAGIGFLCYQVGEEIIDQYSQTGFFNNQRVGEDRGIYYLDLRGIIIDQLHQTGVDDKNIHYLDFCSHCRDDWFYSHRRHDNVSHRRNYSYIAISI